MRSGRVAVPFLRGKTLRRLSPLFLCESEPGSVASIFALTEATPSERPFGGSCEIFQEWPEPCRVSARCGRFPRDSPRSVVPASHGPHVSRRIVRPARAQSGGKHVDRATPGQR